MQKNFFNNLTRIGTDSCNVSQSDLQNENQINHLLDNSYKNCRMTDTINIATSQPNVNYNGPHQVGFDGCNIDDNSKLLHGGQTKTKDRNTLYERQFLSVPYLGRGIYNPSLESDVQRGDVAFNKKTVNMNSEKTHLNHRHYPLLPSLKSSMNNPSNFVEGVADKNWVRGGVPSRELEKDKEYDN